MSRFADLVIKQDRTTEEYQELRDLARQLDYVTNDVGTAIGPSGVISYLRAGSVVLDNAGLHTFLDGVETGRIEADGDFLLGSNIAAAGTTSFAVFTNAQTYNSESVGAGDLLVGDNTASKANILWDKSAGTLLFRGGTTTHAYVNTSGNIIAGGGNVAINADGIRLTGGSGNTNSISWVTGAEGTGSVLGSMYTNITGSSPNRTADMHIHVQREGSGGVNLTLQVTSSSVASLVMSRNQYTFNIVEGGDTFQVQFGTSEVVFNENGLDTDFRVETSGNANAIMVDAGLDAVGIMGVGVSGTALKVYGKLQVAGNVEITNSSRFAVGGVGDTLVGYITNTGGDLAIVGDSDRDIRIGPSGRDKLLFLNGTTDQVYVGITSPMPSGSLLIGLNSIGVHRFDNNDISAPNIEFSRAKGSEGSPAVVDESTLTGRFLFRGWDGDSLISSAQFGGIVTGAVSDEVVPQAIFFKTGSSSTPSERMRIDSAGKIGIGISSGILGKTHIDQSSSTGAIPTLFLDQGDVSEQCIQFSSDAVDRDIHLFTVNVAGAPAMDWLETADVFSLNKGLDVSAGPISTATLTLTAAGPTDNLDVSGVNTIFIDTSNNNVTLGGTVGGVDGQMLFIVVDDATNNFTIENEEGTGNQDFVLHAGADETMTAEHGGWIFVNHGGNHWHDASHAKHV